MARNDWNNKTYDYEFSPASIALPLRVIQEPDVYSGKSTVVRLRTAMNSRVTESDKKIRNQSTFINVSAFGLVAEKIIDLGISKGSEIIVMGEMASNNYENKEGETVYGIQIKAKQVGISVTDRGLQNTDYEPQTSSYSSSDDEEEDDSPRKSRRKKKTSRSSGARRRARSRDEDIDDLDDDLEEDLEEDEDEFEPKPRRNKSKRTRRKVEVDDDVEDYLEDDDDVI